MFEQEEINKLAHKAAEAIGEDLLNYTPNQIRAFEQEMGSLLERRKGQSDAITYMECVGIHELIVDHLFPLEHEQILEYAQLINSKKETHDST
ncbi:hypothetical protein N8979_00160 [bacterium]|nr:hypothetical protein [bacterium]